MTTKTPETLAIGDKFLHAWTDTEQSLVEVTGVETDTITGWDGQEHPVVKITGRVLDANGNDLGVTLGETFPFTYTPGADVTIDDTPAPKALGPRQRADAKTTAQHVALWAADLQAAIDANDVAKAEALTTAMRENLTHLSGILGRAK